ISSIPRQAFGSSLEAPHVERRWPPAVRFAGPRTAACTRTADRYVPCGECCSRQAERPSGSRKSRSMCGQSSEAFHDPGWPVDVMICGRRATKMTCAGVYEGDCRNGKSHGSRVGNHTAEEAEDNTHRHHRGDGDDAVAAATHAPFSGYRL